MKARWLLIGVLTLGCLCVGVLERSGLWRVPTPYMRSVWVSGARASRGDPSLDKHNPRQRMVGDLLTRRLRKGMHRTEVIELLGPPDYPQSPVSDGAHEALGYTLGSPWFDEKILVISLDQAGRVVGVAVTQT